ncbi:MAG: c-type cytochrome [Rhodospirillales bacterium]|nr:c-type cytochrome [Rhodospirillales bacterium]
MRRLTILALALAFITPGAVKADGDPKKGGQAFRACVACHALEPGLHLSGPSLGNFLERPSGSAKGYGRYSPELKSAGFEWSPAVLDAWIEAPEKMIPGTYMSFPGISDPVVRADLVAFLMIAGAEDGVKRVVAEGLIPASWTRSVAPDPIGEGSPSNRIVSIRHCGDSYFIETEDGASYPFWEKNVRLKIDSTDTGPPPGVPVVLGAGMRGDRISVIFRSIADLSRLLVEECG